MNMQNEIIFEIQIAWYKGMVDIHLSPEISPIINFINLN